MLRGRLAMASAAPEQGESQATLVHVPGLSVLQVLSGRLPAPASYCQDENELALVLEGGATLEVGGEVVTLGPGEWVWIPAGTPHLLTGTLPGTSWLTLHHQPAAPAGSVDLAELHGGDEDENGGHEGDDA